jgi:hypothetical protein
VNLTNLDLIISRLLSFYKDYAITIIGNNKLHIEPYDLSREKMYFEMQKLKNNRKDNFTIDSRVDEILPNDNLIDED